MPGERVLSRYFAFQPFVHPVFYKPQKVLLFLEKDLHFAFRYAILIPRKVVADVMELADVTDSKSVGSDTVWVRVPPSAPEKRLVN